jgi:anti-sigma B factor antagonist
MTFSIERSDDVCTVHIVDELVATDRQELRNELLAELARGAHTIRFDFNDAHYIDGAGLGLLVSLAKLVREHVGELRLANLNEDMRSLFMLTRLDALFTIERGEEGDAAPLPADIPPRPTEPPRAAGEERPRP